jgi:hypothetical protein
VNGENMESVLEKINELISAYNATFPVTRSYLDLTDKPAIDGKVLLPDTKMSEFRIPVESLPNEIDLQKLFIEAALQNSETIARAVAVEEIQKAQQLENIPETQGFARDEWKILVFVPLPNGIQKIYKTSVKEITDKAVWATNKHLSENQPVLEQDPPVVEE